jgi:carboxyl-terminal processing protease
VKVNNLDVLEYLNTEVYPYISAPEHIVLSKGASIMFNGLKGTSVEIEIETPVGENRSLTIHRNCIKDNWAYSFNTKKSKKLCDFKQFENNIAYISINSFRDKNVIAEFESYLPNLYNQKGLIIDLRFNSGGLTEYGNTILKYLTEEPFFFGHKGSTREHLPSHKAWGAFNDSAYTNKFGFPIWENEYKRLLL